MGRRGAPEDVVPRRGAGRRGDEGEAPAAVRPDARDEASEARPVSTGARADERAALLAWFDARARDLPWRRTRDPYAVWVSEVMLQQTRVETVTRYFSRFLARFPDAASLAAASEDEVLSLWSGLGYYRRARLLHAGSKHLVQRHGGLVPQDPEARRAIPGVGRYTAGAIGSIAFDLPEPLVDGNVMRVLARLRGIETPLGRAETDARFWEEAEALAPGPRPGALNQALMELGSTVCTPTSPRCDACPVAAGCVARRQGRVEALPVPKPRRAPREVALVAVVPRGADGVWMVRSEEALFGGLWGVPMGEGKGVAAARAVLEAAGLAGEVRARACATVSHELTHRRLSVRVFVADDVTAHAAGPRAVDPRAPGAIGVSRLTRKIVDAAGR